MNIVTLLQDLDGLILDHTKPPITSQLRNKLQAAMDQAEAHSQAVEKQDATLAKQMEIIVTLTKANADLEKQLAECRLKKKKELADWFNDQQEKQRKLIQSKQLNYEA